MKDFLCVIARSGRDVAILVLTFIVMFPTILFANDLSGYYQNKNGSLCIMDGGGDVLVYYESVFTKTAHNCGCSAATKVQGGRIPMDDEFGKKGGIRVEGERLVVASDGNPLCCGAGWPGEDIFERSRAKRPIVCTVKEKSFFYNDGASGFEQTPKYVIAGDSVEILPQSDNQGYVMAKFKGASKDTIGYLKRSDIACRKN